MKNISVVRLSNFILIFVIVFCVNAVFKKPLFADYDPGWHMRAGYLIRSLGFIPSTDPWSYTSDQIWYNLSWLWDILISYANDILTEKHLSLFTSFIFGLTIAYLYLSLDNFGKYKSDAKMVTVALSALAINDLAYLRPQMMTYLFTLITLNIVNRGLKEKALFFYLKLQLINLIWINTHGSFPIIYVIIGTYGLEALKNKDYSLMKRLITATLVSLPVIFINPYGPDIIVGISRTLNSAITDYLNEWHPLTFGRFYGFSLTLIIFILASDFNNPKIRLSYKLLAIIWLLSSLFSIRLFGYLAILGAPYLCAALNYKLPYCKDKPPIPLYAKGTLVIMFIAGWQYLYHTKRYIIQDNKDFPKEQIELLAKNYPNMKIFNDYNQGGAIVYYGEGKLRNFIDSRAGTVYSEELIKDYLAFHNLNVPVTYIYKKYPFDGIIISQAYLRADTVYPYLKNWVKVYENDRLGIFISPRYKKQD